MTAGQPWLQELKLAEAHVNAGRLAEAEAVLRQILKADANQPDALNALAALASGVGQLDVAIALQKRAIAARPNAPLYLSNLGEMYRRAGNLAAAVEHGKKAVALRPSFAVGHNNLGAAQAEAGDVAGALQSYDAALVHRADFAEAHNNRGNALRALGRADEAREAFARAIALRPNYGEAHSNLGNVQRDAGQLAAAEASYRRSLALQPEEVGPLFNLITVLEEQGKLEEADQVIQRAEAAARRVLEVQPENAEAANVLGLACVALGRHDEAVEAFKRAAARTGYVDPWINLGNSLKNLGRMDEALAALDRARELAPQSAAPLLAITQVKVFRNDDDPHLAALEALERKSELAEQQRIPLHFGLAKAYDDLGRPHEAFVHMQAGNALKRQAAGYDEVRSLEFFERIKATFDVEFIARARAGYADATPIFVIGMPRSGTTLVEQIISSHPLVGAAGEITALNDATRVLGAFPEAVSGAEDANLARVGEAYVRKLRTYAPNATHVTDKTPSNFYLIGLIHMALPQAKIVHVTRDPVDACLSCYSKLFTRGQNYSYDLAELGRYYRAYDSLMQHWRRVLPAGRMLEVRYEDVVGDTEGESRRLLAYCGLDWDEGVLAFHKSARAVSTASANQVRQPIYITSVARWRRYEAHLGPLLEALGDLVKA
ncbi:MAG: sulfotransferase [Hyphomonadaceae bacterium]